jgi:hypothetical protein
MVFRCDCTVTAFATMVRDVEGAITPGRARVVITEPLACRLRFGAPRRRDSGQDKVHRPVAGGA